MSEQALRSLATMRDQKIVFHGVREAMDDESLSPEARLEKIREFYAAFDESHPAGHASMTSTANCLSKQRGI